MVRSMLFIPGNNPAMLQNADVFGADAVIIDLEDAVSIQEKDAARILVKAYLESIDHPPMKIYIRINGLDTTDYEKDLQSVVTDQIDGIVLPKAKVCDVERLLTLLYKIESETHMQKIIGIIPIVESAKSVLEIEKLAALSRIQGMLLGAEDLSADMELMRTITGTEIEYPRARMAFACKAYKIDAIDTPFTDTSDNLGLIADCQKAQNLGLNAKAAIHPNQLETIHDVFSPSLQRIEWAKRVLKAAKKADDQGLGVFSLDGKMIDKPIIERATKIMESAKKYRLLPVEHA